MLGHTDAQNRLRSRIGAPTSTRSTAESKAGEAKPHGIQNVSPTEPLSRPQTEAARHCYEVLISRGIALLQPHSVLSIAEAYHAWYHSAGSDVAGSILYQTLGRNASGVRAPGDGMYDIRSVYWLGLCYWHIGEVSTVYALVGPATLESEEIIEVCDGESADGAMVESAKLRSMKALACSLWLMAMSCTRLDKWQEAEDHLNTLRDVLRLVYAPDAPGHSAGADMQRAVRADSSLYLVPTLADVADLLGLVCMRTNRVAQSEAHSLEAVRRNQLQWSACRRLCELGYSGQLSEALAVDLDDVTERAALGRQADAVLEGTPVPASRLASRIQGPTTAMAQLKPGLVAAAKNSASQLRQPGRPGDEPASARGSTRSRTLAKPVVAPVAATLAVSAGGRARATLGQKNMAMKTPGRPRVDVVVGSDKKRTRNGSAIRSASVGRVGGSADGTGAVRSGGGGSSADGAALAHMHGLIGRKADVYAHMCAYRAAQGLECFAGVAVEQQNSAWGLCVLGRICFEAGRYPEAARAFAAAHVLAPYRVRDMDVYSTLLWHMRREEDLAQLAHAMVRAGRGWSPEAWVAVANCFSLEGDHASAQRSLGRSIQLYAAGAVPRSDSGGVAGLAYAHTLVGHESVAAGDEAERAQQAFRTAMRIDGRHYNAWYGLGMVYLRQGRLELAEYHFKRALALNTQNPLLLQSAGALLEARGDYAGALAVYERVLSSSGDVANDDAAPHHALSFVLFKRARVLVVLERFAEAAAVLGDLLRRCPREFNVPFLLGQTYTRLRRFREAAACLTRALDIAPENAPSVREAFDALYHEEEQGEGDLLPGQEESPLGSSNSGVMSPGAESPDHGSPPSSLLAGWGGDWRGLSSADDRVARALDFDV